MTSVWPDQRTRWRPRVDPVITVVGANGRAVELETIPPNELIGPELWNFSRNTIFADGRASMSKEGQHPSVEVHLALKP